MQSWVKHRGFRSQELGSLAALWKGRWHKWFHLIFGSLSIYFGSQEECVKWPQPCSGGHRPSIDDPWDCHCGQSWLCRCPQQGWPVKIRSGCQSWVRYLCRDCLLALLQPEGFENPCFSREFWFSKWYNAWDNTAEVKKWIEIYNTQGETDLVLFR